MPAVEHFTVSVTLTSRSSISTVGGPQSAITEVLNELKIPVGLKITDVHVVAQR